MGFTILSRQASAFLIRTGYAPSCEQRDSCNLNELKDPLFLAVMRQAFIAYDGMAITVVEASCVGDTITKTLNRNLYLFEASLPPSPMFHKSEPRAKVGPVVKHNTPQQVASEQHVKSSNSRWTHLC